MMIRFRENRHDRHLVDNHKVKIVVALCTNLRDRIQQQQNQAITGEGNLIRKKVQIISTIGIEIRI
jgi:hypothetical protein